MPNKLQSILRKSARKNKYNILTFSTHERYQENLAKTGHSFYLWDGPGIKPWKNEYARMPENHHLLDKSLEDRQFPMYLDIDFVLSQNKYAHYEVSRQISEQLGVPLVTLEHTLPPPDWKKHKYIECSQMTGDIDVFISEYNKNKWRWEDNEKSRIVHHGIDTERFHPGFWSKEPLVCSVVNDWINREWCQLAGQKILTSEGYIPIEKIKVGDKVLTDCGKFNIVTKVFERDYFGDLVKIKLDLYKDYICFTPDHNIRVFRNGQEKYIPANSLRIGDQLKFPKIKQIDFSLLDCKENFEYSYIIGSIIADGSITNKGNIEITVEKEDFKRADKLKCILEKICGGYSSIIDKGSTYKVSSSSKIFANWLKDKIGKYSKTKSLPDFIYYGSDMIKLSALIGLWDCDGSFKSGKCRGERICYSTTSVKLASQVSSLLHNFGIKCNIKKEKRTTNKSNGKIVYIYRVLSQDKENFRKCKELIENGNINNSNYGYSYKITDYQIEEYSGKVYNCEVSNDHSYVVYPGFVSHNCCNFSMWQQVTQWPNPIFPINVWGDTEGLSKSASNTDHLIAEYQRSLIFVNTSTISPVPTALMEAMSCGCAVISTNNCMIPEVIDNEINGLLTNDVNEMREMIAYLLNNPNKAIELGKNARRKIEEKFSLKQFVNQWNEVFDEVANL